MLKISEYEDRAVECRKMAIRTHDVTKKAQFEEIGRAWQMLAETRMKQLERRLRSRVEFRRRKGLKDRIPDASSKADPDDPTLIGSVGLAIA